MTRETLEALIGRMLDAETRTTPPPTGEERTGCTAVPVSPNPTSMAGWHRSLRRMAERRERGSCSRSAALAGALARWPAIEAAVRDVDHR